MWTSVSDLPTLKIFVFVVVEEVWLKNTLPTYNLDICPKFRCFFTALLMLTSLAKTSTKFVQKLRELNKFKHI